VPVRRVGSGDPVFDGGPSRRIGSKDLINRGPYVEALERVPASRVGVGTLLMNTATIQFLHCRYEKIS